MNDIKSSTRDGQFLIDGMLSTKMTILAGDPKSGKSFLTVAMVAALVNGDAEFLGHAIPRRLHKVAFALTDPDGPGETAQRFNDALPDPDVIVIGEIRGDTDSPDYWARQCAELVALEVELLVLDNVLGCIDGDIAEPKAARAFLDRLDPIMLAGIPILVVTHTAKAAAAYGGAGVGAAIGGRLFGARPRVLLHMMKAQRLGMRLRIDGNYAETIEYPLDFDNDKAPYAFTIGEAKAAAKKSPVVSIDKWAKLAAKVVADQPDTTSYRALGDRYADGMDLGSGYVRDRLARLVKHDGEVWKMA